MIRNFGAPRHCPWGQLPDKRLTWPPARWTRLHEIIQPLGSRVSGRLATALKDFRLLNKGAQSAGVPALGKGNERPRHLVGIRGFRRPVQAQWVGQKVLLRRRCGQLFTLMLLEAQSLRSPALYLLLNCVNFLIEPHICRFRPVIAAQLFERFPNGEFGGFSHSDIRGFSALFAIADGLLPKTFARHFQRRIVRTPTRRPAWAGADARLISSEARTVPDMKHEDLTIVQLSQCTIIGPTR
jgi:hypothetical protein